MSHDRYIAWPARAPQLRYILAMFVRGTMAVATATIVVGMLGGCGPKVPQHDGYRARRHKPWKKAKLLKFDEDKEAEVDHFVDYGKRRRARWYAVELPSDGEIQIKMEVTPPPGKEEFDLAFEVLNPDYKVINTANAEDDDAGELKKNRTLYELKEGRYYIHVYAQGRMDRADFSLRIKFKSGTLPHETDFPAQVAFVTPLATVPAFDDAPTIACGTCNCRKDARCKAECSRCSRKPVNCRKCNCRRSCKWSCKKKCGIRTASRPKKPKPGNAQPAATSVSGRIVRLVKSGSGTKITINRGAKHGVAVGWKGSIVRKGKTIQNGHFTVGAVNPTTSFATVAASPDAVRGAPRVRLRAP